MLEVYDFDHLVMISALKMGLKVSNFYFFVLKRFPHDFSKLLTHANKYIDVEDGMAEKWKEKK